MNLSRAKTIALLFLMACMCHSYSSFGQAEPTEETSAVPVHADEPDAPTVTGFNASAEYMAQHISSTGWSNVVTPTVIYRFNEHFFLTASVPWYLTAKNYVSERTGLATTTDVLETGKNVLGDATASGNFAVEHHAFSYLGTATVSFATGNDYYGLTANTTTYDITNHFDYAIWKFNPDIEIGFGDSSTLANSLVRKSYTAVGSLADFQAGMSVDLPWGMNLDTEAYENLPVGNQKVYGTITTTDKKGKTVTKQVLEGNGVAEDNGVNTELDIPVGNHFQLAGTYERSFRQSLDSVSVELKWTLRASAKKSSK